MTAVAATLSAVSAGALTPALIMFADRFCRQRAEQSLLRSRVFIAVASVVCATATATAVWRWDFANCVSALPLLFLAFPAVLVDLQEQRLPGSLVLPFSAVAILASVTPGVLGGVVGSTMRVLVAVVVTTVALIVVGLIDVDLIGWGDIRFAPGLAAYLAARGSAALVIGFVLVCACLVMTVVIGRAWRRHSAASSRSTASAKASTLPHLSTTEAAATRDTSPYGPAMLLGTVGALLIVGP